MILSRMLSLLLWKPGTTMEEEVLGDAVHWVEGIRGSFSMSRYDFGRVFVCGGRNGQEKEAR